MSGIPSPFYCSPAHLLTCPRTTVQAFVVALNYGLSVTPSEYARYYFALRSICHDQARTNLTLWPCLLHLLHFYHLLAT